MTTNGVSRVYTIRSPLVSRAGQYRALLNLRAVDEILEAERPDVIESADPYQLGWKAVKLGRVLRAPVIGFYHSHFPEAYLRNSAKIFGKIATRRVMNLSRVYVRKLYNEHAATLVASERLASVLRDWGVRNVRVVSLGVNLDIFRPDPSEKDTIRRALGLNHQKKSFFMSAVLRKKRTRQPCLPRSNFCSNAVRTNSNCSSLAMDPNELSSGNSRRELKTFHGFVIAPIRASSPATIAPPISSFIPVFRKHLDWRRWRVRRAGRR